MKKPICIVLALLACASLASCRAAEAPADAPVTSTVREDAPPVTEEQATAAPSVPLAYGTSPEMLDPSFWKADGTVLMTEDEIAAVNAANPLMLRYPDAEIELAPYEISGTLDGYVVRTIVGYTAVPDVTWYKHGEPLGWEYWYAIDSNIALDTVGDSVMPEYAVCTERTTAYIYPTDDFVGDDPSDNFYNGNIISELYHGEGAVVVHTSADGEWCFALAGSFAGWVKSASLAFCRDKAEFDAARAPGRFLVVTDERLVLDSYPEDSPVSGEVLYMGTKLALAEGGDAGEREPYGAYTVRMPVRDADGMLSWQTALVPVSCGVSEGYLPLTSANIVAQAYKFLGRVYGWGGTYNSNDCSGMVRQIYRTFGVELPRNSGMIAEVGGFAGGVLDGGAGEPERLTVLSSLVPGSILQFPGHVMLYLGQSGGVPYVISSCGAYCEPENGELTSANCVCITPMTVLRGSGKTWLEDVSRYIIPKKG